MFVKVVALQRGRKTSAEIILKNDSCQFVHVIAVQNDHLVYAQFCTPYRDISALLVMPSFPLMRSADPVIRCGCSVSHDFVCSTMFSVCLP
jgi:hypothetical protein